ncbi:hypothetical protein AAC387_Pa06g1148 [Persea americana]
MKESMGLFLLFLWVSSVAAVTKGGFSAVHEPHFLSGFGILDSKVGTGDQSRPSTSPSGSTSCTPVDLGAERIEGFNEDDDLDGHMEGVGDSVRVPLKGLDGPNSGLQAMRLSISSSASSISRPSRGWEERKGRGWVER